jgi:hypothetical protein
MQRIPLSHFVVIFCLHSLQQARSPLFKEAASIIFAINTMYYNNSFFLIYWNSILIISFTINKGKFGFKIHYLLIILALWILSQLFCCIIKYFLICKFLLS